MGDAVVEGPNLEDAEGREVPHDIGLANTAAALGVDSAEIVSSDDLVTRLG